MSQSPASDLNRQLGILNRKNQLLTADEEVRWARSMHQAALEVLLEGLSAPKLICVLEEQLRDYSWGEDNVAQKEELRAKTFLAFAELRVINLGELRDGVDIQFACARILRAKKLLSSWHLPSHWIIHELYPLLIPNCEEHIAKRINRCRRRFFDAREHLILANLGLVKSIAAKYKYLGPSFEELVQEGMLGLIKAVERFDHKLGFRFSSYAYRSINQAIHYHVEKSFSRVRVPNPIMRHKQAIDTRLHQIEQSKAKPVSVKEIAAEFDMDEDDLLALVKRSTRLSADTMAVPQQTFGIEFLADEGRLGGEESIESISRTDLASKLLSNLSERDKHIIMMRFGLGYRKEHSLEEIAVQVGLSRERVRQIANDAISRLRSAI